MTTYTPSGVGHSKTLNQTFPHRRSIYNRRVGRFQQIFKLETVKKILTYILRFIPNCKNNINHSGPLSITELNQLNFKSFAQYNKAHFAENIGLLYA